jgi:hypothetical protein
MELDMSPNDRNLLKQMITAGRFNVDIYNLLVEHNKIKSREIIQAMGNKWCCHPDNAIKKLDVPLPILNEPRGSRVLKRK